MTDRQKTTLLRGGRLTGILDTSMNSVLIEDGRIVWIGRAKDAPSAKRVIELDGSRVIPGLTDAHAHLYMRAQELMNLGLGPRTTTLSELLERVRAACASAGPDEWVLSADYSEQFLAERRHPSRQELDAVSAGKPVLLRRTGGHLSVANSAALKHAGFDDTTPDPLGGTIERADGKLSGVLTENAADMVAALAPPPSTGRKIDTLRQLADECLQYGIVAVVEAAVGFNNGFDVEWKIWNALRDQGGLPLRMGFMLRIDPRDAQARSLEPGAIDVHWQARTLKFFVDGIIGARTAAFREPYADRDTCGILMDEPEALRTKVAEAHAQGWQLAGHVIGDRGINHWLDCLAQAQQACPRHDARHRLEHFAVSDLQALAKVQALGAVIVPQYGFLRRLGQSFAEAVGKQRAAQLYRGCTLCQAGIPVAGSSDHPIGGLSPYLGIAAAMDRMASNGLVLNADEALTAEEALLAYSVGGAYVMGHETRRGRLQVGQLADIAVLDRDILAIPSSEIEGARSRLTLVGGVEAYGDGTLTG
ncbi:amidohydrolase [Castellaniella sp.]|uniref:amidohydrolase n=1 Tax=Castellaniella sp. TaxID=1955812 RepID=UPI00355FD80B